MAFFIVLLMVAWCWGVGGSGRGCRLGCYVAKEKGGLTCWVGCGADEDGGWGGSRCLAHAFPACSCPRSIHTRRGGRFSHSGRVKGRGKGKRESRRLVPSRAPCLACRRDRSVIGFGGVRVSVRARANGPSSNQSIQSWAKRPGAAAAGVCASSFPPATLNPGAINRPVNEEEERTGGLS